MKTQKIIASLFLVFPTLFFLYTGLIGLIFHSPFYILIPVILIGVNISLYKYNRIFMIFGIIALVALIISFFISSGIYSYLLAGLNILLPLQIFMVKLSLVATLCLIYPLVFMIKAVINTKK